MEKQCSHFALLISELQIPWLLLALCYKEFFNIYPFLPIVWISWYMYVCVSWEFLFWPRKYARASSHMNAFIFSRCQRIKILKILLREVKRSWRTRQHLLVTWGRSLFPRETLCSEVGGKPSTPGFPICHETSHIMKISQIFFIFSQLPPHVLYLTNSGLDYAIY